MQSSTRSPLKQYAFPALLLLGLFASFITFIYLGNYVRKVNFPPPNQVPIAHYQLTGQKVSLEIRVDEKLYYDRDSMGSIFYGEVPLRDVERFEKEKSLASGKPNAILKIHPIGAETLIAVGRPNTSLERKWDEILKRESALHAQNPKAIGQEILDADEEVLGVKFGLTTTIELSKRFGPAKVADGSVAKSLHTWKLKDLVIAVDGRSSTFTGGTKVDLVSAMAWRGTLNEALRANKLKTLPNQLGSLTVGQARTEVESLLKPAPRDGTGSTTRIMIRQVGETNVFCWVTWSDKQTLRSIQFSNSWE